ncbi:MAG: YkgJ family cysteine cluster protein [Rhodospirillales bacterium]|nr:YkgJ family cysteine cluster protein [Rhodospirillales bacterium]
METEEKPSDAPQDYWVTLEQQVREIVSGTMATSKAIEELPLLSDATVQFFERLTRDILETLPPSRPIACAQGCAFCCTSTEVHASALEVIGIAAHMADQFNEQETKEISQKIRETTETKGAQNKNESPPSMPCPLLKDSRCSVYPVRPFVCRGFNSYDAVDCERHKAGDAETEITGYPHQDIIAHATLRGVQRGLADCGLDGDALDLTPALAIMLETPDAALRWRAGENIFEKAHARQARK